jgi:hypothetical protein
MALSIAESSYIPHFVGISGGVSFAIRDSSVAVINTASDVGNAVHAVAATVKDTADTIFSRLLDQPLTACASAAFPVVMGAISLGYFIKDMVYFVKSCFLGLGRDIWEHLQHAVMDLLRVISSALAPLKFFLDICKVTAPLLLQIAGIISGVFSIVCYVWQIVRDSLSLKDVNSALDVIDDHLIRKDLTPTQKAAAILQYFEEIKNERENRNQESLENVIPAFREAATEFLADQTTERMEERFGKEAYQRISKAIECLRHSEAEPQEAVRAIGHIREIREFLNRKKISHWISIAACICGIAFAIIGIVCPYLGAAASAVQIVGYVIIGCGVAGWSANALMALITRWQSNKQNSLEEQIGAREPRVVIYNGQQVGLASVPADDPVLKEIESQVQQMAFQHLFNAHLEESPEERRRRIEKTLLKSHRFDDCSKVVLRELKAWASEPLREDELYGQADEALDWLQPDLQVVQPTLEERLAARMKAVKAVGVCDIALSLRKMWVETFNLENGPLPFVSYV